MSYRAAPIADRIACWKQAFDVVREELRMPKSLPHFTENQIITLAATVAATLAVGATARDRHSENEEED